jgi:hypothetical protein
VAHITDAEVFRRKALAPAPGVPAALVSLFEFLGPRLPPRTTVRQVWAFQVIMAAHWDCRPITLSDVAKRVSGGDVRTALSVSKTLGLFMNKTPENPDALEWVMQDPDPLDGRRKFLRLSRSADGVDECGEDIALQIAERLAGATGKSSGGRG